MPLSEQESGYLYPLQRCLTGGSVRSLSDHELLAIMLGAGTKKSNVFHISSDLLKDFGGLPGLARAGIRELSRTHGVGLKKAVKIHTAFELGRRIITGPSDAGRLNTPRSVWETLLPEMACLEREEFRALILNNKNVLIKNCVISIGTVSEAIVHPREVFREAIREGGASIIIAHNHPTGEVTPSREDVRTTERLVQAGGIIGIPLLDHVIITNTSFYSMKEGGYL